VDFFSRQGRYEWEFKLIVSSFGSQNRLRSPCICLICGC